MERRSLIDTSFDVRLDTPEGADPDAASATLRRYHQLLWDKPLPTGGRFSLRDDVPGSYLHHQSHGREFWMTSDSVVHSYRYWTRFDLPGIVNRFASDELDAFDALSYTIGAMMLFPSWTGTRHWSINQARGMLTRIADRMDLTLECIRRNYAGIDSPMSGTLNHYQDFFALFEDFTGYARFFLLDDLLTDDCSAVRFFLPFDDFRRPSATPATTREYRSYLGASAAFVRARNARIETWQATGQS